MKKSLENKENTQNCDEAQQKQGNWEGVRHFTR